MYLLHFFFTRPDKPVGPGAANESVAVKANSQSSGAAAVQNPAVQNPVVQNPAVQNQEGGTTRGMSQGPPPPSLYPPPYKNGELIIVCKCGDLRQDRYASIPCGRTFRVSTSFFGVRG